MLGPGQSVDRCEGAVRNADDTEKQVCGLGVSFQLPYTLPVVCRGINQGFRVTVRCDDGVTEKSFKVRFSMGLGWGVYLPGWEINRTWS